MICARLTVCALCREKGLNMLYYIYIYIYAPAWNRVYIALGIDPNNLGAMHQTHLRSQHRAVAPIEVVGPAIHDDS